MDKIFLKSSLSNCLFFFFNKCNEITLLTQSYLLYLQCKRNLQINDTNKLTYKHYLQFIHILHCFNLGR